MKKRLIDILTSVSSPMMSGDVQIGEYKTPYWFAELLADALIENDIRLPDLKVGGDIIMNHDNTHCGNYCEECPKDCYRAQLTEDLRRIRYPWPVSFALLKNTDMCPKWPSKKETL